MILDKFKLNGRLALVTGASRGLGQAMALGLAEAGADIVGLDRSGSEDTGTKVRALGCRFHEVVADLRTTSVDDLNSIVTEIVATMGHLDILVNNAGIIRRAPAVEFSEDDWDDVLHINLRALFFLSQAAAKVMIPQKSGKTMNVGSMLSFQGGITVPSYTAAKSGVAGVTRALANEWAQYGINVNAIAPGYMATANTAPLQADAARNASILERIPAGRWGEPDDLQGTAVFLASDAAAYMHGAIVPVDGGWLTR